MLDHDNIEEETRTIILELMKVLYNHGILEIHMGGILRLLGVEEDKAAEHDDERICIDEKFAKYINKMIDSPSIKQQNQTLH